MKLKNSNTALKLISRVLTYGVSVASGIMCFVALFVRCDINEKGQSCRGIILANSFANVSIMFSIHT